MVVGPSRPALETLQEVGGIGLGAGSGAGGVGGVGWGTGTSGGGAGFGSFGIGKIDRGKRPAKEQASPVSIPHGFFLSEADGGGCTIETGSDAG